jgi:hypothetical protein
MIYLKSIVIGAAGAILAVLLWVFVAFVLPIFVPIALSQVTGSSSGGIGAAYIDSGSIALAALIGFAIGSLWTFRRLSQQKWRP